MNIKHGMTKITLKEMEKITGGPLTLGKLLWAIRECEEIPLSQLAKKLGISTQHLCDIERGRKNISPNLAAIYAKKLGYAPELFIQLALQNAVDRAKLNVFVTISPMQKYSAAPR